MTGNVATMDEFAIEGCTIKVRVEGEDTAPALVLSHMLGTDLSLWDNLVPEFVKHFRVVRYDTRGHGGSGLGDTPVTLARLGRDVLAILDQLGIERAHFCGLSMGGAVGQWLLVHAPARLERAVIAGSAAKLGEPAVWNARIAAALADGMEQAVEPTLERWFGPAFAERAPEPVEAVRALVRATPPEGYAACCAALRDMDLRETLRAVTHPVLVLRGADDPSVSAEAAGYLVEAMANATSVEVEARHCASIEAEADFSAAVVKFLTAKTAPKTVPKTASRRAARPAAKPAETRDKPSARRVGQRGLVAARRPVAQTAPISGKAVAKASATRKTAARAAPRPPAPSRRAAAAETTRASGRKIDASRASAPGKSAPGKSAPGKSAPGKSAPGKSAPGKSAPGKAPRAAKVKAPGRGRAMPGEKSAAGNAATSAPARRTAATVRMPAAKGKPPTAAALRAAAKSAIVKAVKAKTTKAEPVKAKMKLVVPAAKRAGKASVAPVKAAAGAKAVTTSAKRAAARPSPAQRASAKPAPTKPTKSAPTKSAPTKSAPTKSAPTKSAPTKSAPTKSAPTKSAPTKSAPTKPTPAKPAPTKVAASRRVTAPAAKPQRASGRGPAGSGRRKP